MAKNQQKIGKELWLFLIAFLLGALFAYGVTHGQGVQTRTKTVILLHDRDCPVCEAQFADVAKKIREGVTAAFVEEYDVKSAPGERIYRELMEDNVNVVPLVVITKDLKGTKAWNELNKVLLGGVTSLVELKKYYVLRPRWIVRRYNPDGKTHVAELNVEGNVNRDAILQSIYAAADNVVIREINIAGDHIVLINGDPDVIKALARNTPLAAWTETSLEVPRIEANVFSEPELQEALRSYLASRGVVVTAIKDLNSQRDAFAITTNRPYVLAKIFPGAKVYLDGIMYEKGPRVTLDIYLDGKIDGNVLSALKRVAISAPNTTIVRPHYIVIPTVQGFTAPTGPEQVRRSLYEYCVYLNYGTAIWFAFADGERSRCSSVEQCWKDVARDLNIDTTKVENCVNSGNNVLAFLAKDTSERGITSGGVLINGWLPWPNNEDLIRGICAFLNPKPNALCGGE